MWVRRTVRVAVWGATWGPAILGVALLVAAWLGRSNVRLVWVRTQDHIGYVQLTPRHLDVAYWRRAEYEPSVRQRPLLAHGRLALLTTVEPTPPEPTTTSEKLADADRSWHALGFGVVKGNGFWPPTPSQREVWIPTWFAVVANFAPLAVARLARRRRVQTSRR